uniref:Uncharacterized protein n=1 Tax=Oryza punctata TaxID=4537 RepID=A0A0E0LUH4_ORYPU
MYRQHGELVLSALPGSHVRTLLDLIAVQVSDPCSREVLPNMSREHPEPARRGRPVHPNVSPAVEERLADAVHHVACDVDELVQRPPVVDERHPESRLPVGVRGAEHRNPNITVKQWRSLAAPASRLEIKVDAAMPTPRGRGVVGEGADMASAVPRRTGWGVPAAAPATRGVLEEVGARVDAAAVVPRRSRSTVPSAATPSPVARGGDDWVLLATPTAAVSSRRRSVAGEACVCLGTSPRLAMAAAPLPHLPCRGRRGALPFVGGGGERCGFERSLMADGDGGVADGEEVGIGGRFVAVAVAEATVTTHAWGGGGDESAEMQFSNNGEVQTPSQMKIQLGFVPFKYSQETYQNVVVRLPGLPGAGLSQLVSPLFFVKNVSTHLFKEKCVTYKGNGGRALDQDKNSDSLNP